MKICDNPKFQDMWQDLMHKTETVLSSCHEEGAANFNQSVDALICGLQDFKTKMNVKNIPEKSYALVHGGCKNLILEIVRMEPNGDARLLWEDGSVNLAKKGTFFKL